MAAEQRMQYNTLEQCAMLVSICPLTFPSLIATVWEAGTILSGHAKVNS